MMMSEFIERTGFEPTADEYREIEAEYMGCDIDKDKFCKVWKKSGGIQRLSRMRVRKIEELESKIREMGRRYDEMYAAYSKRYQSLEKEMQRRVGEATEAYDLCQEEVDRLNGVIYTLQIDKKEAEEKLDKIREAFAIIGAAKEV